MMEKVLSEKIIENVYIVKDNLNYINKKIHIVAVTKNIPANTVNILLDNNEVNIIGENKVQELLEKYNLYNRKSCDIHFIGHLQSNKVKYIVDKVDMIESVDSIKLANTINNECKKINKIMPILVQVNIRKEKSKFGIFEEDLYDFLLYLSKLDYIKVKGLMFIPPMCNNDNEKHIIFRDIQKLFVDISSKNIDNVNMEYLSAGMSDDYMIAIKYGSNIIRLGRCLFGSRK